MTLKEIFLCSMFEYGISENLDGDLDEKVPNCEELSKYLQENDDLLSTYAKVIDDDFDGLRLYVYLSFIRYEHWKDKHGNMSGRRSKLMLLIFNSSLKKEKMKTWTR